MCVYEIWLSVLDCSFVTHLGEIAGVLGMAVWGMQYGVWSMGYGVWGMECVGIAVCGMHIFIHTAHVWKY